MLYLSGKIHPRLFNVPNLGFIKTPWGGSNPYHQIWAVDSGCYSNKDFSVIKYYDWVIRKHNSNCLFVPLPDMVGNAKKTLEQFNKYYPLFQYIKCNLAFVAQDGLADTEIPWDRFHTLFVGGTTDWKLSGFVEDLIKEAKLHNKWIHIGRVNSFRRIKRFAKLEVDSVDGTYAAIAPDILIPKLLRWAKWLNENTSSN